MINNIQLIAEVKTQSPSGWKSDNSWDELFEVANEHGDILSIHTDPRWGGAFNLIEKARLQTTKPILAKGIHKSDDDIKRALGAGADFVLVVGRVPSIHFDQCLIEPYTIIELKNLPTQTKVVWNSRDLHKLDQPDNLKIETFSMARNVFDGWLCQASNLRTVDDVEKGADAVLVGTHLLEFIESTRQV